MINNSEFGARMLMVGVLAFILTLDLAAWDGSPLAEQAGLKLDQLVASAGKQTERMVRGTERGIGHAQAVISERTAEASQAIDNEALIIRVKAALIAEMGLRSTGIEVRAHRGVVRLFGTIDTAANRDRTAQIAATVHGAQFVKSNLLVTSATP